MTFHIAQNFPENRVAGHVPLMTPVYTNLLKMWALTRDLGSPATRFMNSDRSLDSACRIACRLQINRLARILASTSRVLGVSRCNIITHTKRGLMDKMPVA